MPFSKQEHSIFAGDPPSLLAGLHLVLMSILTVLMFRHEVFPEAWCFVVTIPLVFGWNVLRSRGGANGVWARSCAAAMCAYVCGALILAFAVLFGKLGMQATGSVPGTDFTSFNASMYLSTVTFTTLGYGDLVPANSARNLAILEVLTGYVSLGLAVVSISGAYAKPSLTSASGQSTSTPQVADAPPLATATTTASRPVEQPVLGARLAPARWFDFLKARADRNR